VTSSSGDSARLRVGDRAGAYLIDREIARGGQGVVYAGRHEASGRRVAIKILLDRDPNQATRFRREAQALLHLRHPNLLEVIEVGEWGGRPFLVTELIEGATLKDIVVRGGVPPAERVVELLTPVAAALETCHREGILHRDVKPANVLVDTASGRIVLVDFGLVRRAVNSGGSLDLTGGGLSSTGEMVGTPSYMAPEQLDNDDSMGPTVDVYGLGSTLFYLLTGEPPYDGSSIYNVATKLLKDPPPDPRSSREGVPAPLAELCLRCLAKEPEQRPGSALAFAEALRGALASSPKGAASVLGPLLAGVGVVALLLLVGAFLWLRGTPVDLVFEGDAEEVWVNEVSWGKVTAGSALSLELEPGRSYEVRVVREGAEAITSFEVTGPDREEHRIVLRTDIPVERHEAAVLTVRTRSGEPARDASGQELVDLQAPESLPLLLGRYTVTARANAGRSKTVRLPGGGLANRDQEFAGGTRHVRGPGRRPGS
jgi:predicted Ser/Thr protein kinase